MILDYYPSVCKRALRFKIPSELEGFGFVASVAELPNRSQIVVEYNNREANRGIRLINPKFQPCELMASSLAFVRVTISGVERGF